MQIRFLITNAYGGGGTIRATLIMANALARRGHDVEVASVLRGRRDPVFDVDDAVRLRPLLDRRRAQPTGRPHGAIARWAGARLLHRPSVLIHRDDRRHHRFTLRSDLALLAYLRSLRGGVLVTTRPGLSLAAARLTSRRVVRIAQAHVPLGRNTADLRATFAVRYPRLDAVVTLTEREAQAYVDLLGDTVPVRTIPNAVADQRPQGRATGKVVVAAGRLVRTKGFDLLVDAWRQVAARHPGWQLHIYGRGPAERALRRRIVRAGLDGQVHLMGFSTDLPARIAVCSLFVLSSRSEAFPMVLLEAMAVGVPAVSFDCATGPSELIEHGVTGLLVAEGAVDQLAGAIGDLLDDPSARARMGAAAARAAAAYSTDRIAACWEELFTQLGQRGTGDARSSRGRVPLSR